MVLRQGLARAVGLDPGIIRATLRMSWRKTFHTAWTSYAAMAGTILASLLTIRLATAHLSQEEFGLWSFTLQTVGYFLLLDFGVANALGRLFGEPLASQNQAELNAWFNLAILVLSAQAALITGVGFFLRDWVIAWFNIPEPLRPEASGLLTAFLVIQAVNLVLRVNSAMLYAQNRAYLANILPVIGIWAALGVFLVMLRQGAGVMAYAWSSAIGVLIWGIVGTVAVVYGPNRFAFSLRGIHGNMIRELFLFSSAVFIIAISIQVVLVGQSLVITKMIGIAAGAVYVVTSRIPMMAMQLVWKPFDAFAPRWQQAYCDGGSDKVRHEFSTMVRISLLSAVIAAAAVVLINPAFVSWWTKPEYFGGRQLNVLLAVYLLLQTCTHCFAYAFTLQKRMRLWTMVEVVSVALSRCDGLGRLDGGPPRSPGRPDCCNAGRTIVVYRLSRSSSHGRSPRRYLPEGSAFH